MTQMLDSALEHFYRIEKFMESMSDLDKLLQVIMGEASAATNAESSSLALYDEGSRELHFYAASGEGGEGEVEQKLKTGHKCFSVCILVMLNVWAINILYWINLRVMKRE